MRTRKLVCGFLLGLALTLAGCARVPSTNPQDPYEHYNRKVFNFNLAVDRAIYRPVARTYNAIVPVPLNIGITNFFDNVDEVTNIANDLLQVNFNLAAINTWRLLINSTVGIFGLFDVASHLNLPPRKNDFGRTLAKWGSRETPYFVIPFWGPSTFRDSVALAIDYEFFSVYPYIHPRSLRFGLLGLNLLDRRAALLSTDRLVDQAFDPYVFVRDAYLQRRAAQINQTLGKPSALEENGNGPPPHSPRRG